MLIFLLPKPLLYTNQTITFTDYSGGATSWSWNFGAGATPATASGKGPHNVTYSTPGTKTVTLTINGSITSNQTLTILPDRPTPYTLADGGNFEVNPSDFAPLTLPTSNPSGCATFTAPTQWERGNSAIAGKNGTLSGSNAWVTSLTANYQNNSKCYLYTPNFDFSLLCTYTLSFYIKMNVENRYDGMIVEYSTNKGTTWTKLNNVVAANWYNNTTNTDAPYDPWGPNVPLFTGSFASYTQRTCDVSFLAGNANVAFRFYFASDFSVNGAGVALEDFTISKTACPSAPTITLGSISPTTYCAGATLSVPFSTTGTFNPGNTFTAELSDASGNFTTPIATATGTSPINLTIPIAATTSSNYQVRVVSSDPAVISNLSPAITINALPSVTLTSDDMDNSICEGTNVTFTATAGYSNYNFRINGISVQSGTSNTYSTTSLNNGDVIDVIATSSAGCSNTSNTITMTVIGNTAPTVQAKAVVFSSLTTNSVKIEWENGNGTGRLVLMKASSPINANPLTNNTFYNANTIFGSGDLVDGGYVVYTGNGNNVTVTNLVANTVYYVAVYEYNDVACRPQKTLSLIHYLQTSPGSAFITTTTTWVGIFSPMDIVAGTSSNYPVGNEPDKAIDNNLSTQYINNDIINEGLIVQLTSGASARRIAITTGTNAPENDPVQITVSGSNDGVTYTPVTTFELPACLPDRAYTRLYEFMPSTAYTYYKIIVNNVNSGCGMPSAFHITEVQLFREPSVLPIQILNFDAQLKSDFTTLITWSSLEEQTIQTYTIEKSYDLNRVFTLTTLPNTHSQQYSYLDPEKWKQKTYYRLKWIDLQGNAQLTDWKEVNAPLADEIKIFPNPIQNEFSVRTHENILKIELFNTLGQKVQEWKPSNHYLLNPISPGTYLFVVYTDQKIYKEKVKIH
ncbi:MAG: hypothetical protein KatS3mg035_0277 [Bacteroidia bacterium]|nr:MAG: hypothetical protein KatS3mg035_0277 [Bacteroidia bacterium]